MEKSMSICELYNEDNNRKAIVAVDKSLGEDIYYVDAYEDGQFVKYIECRGHSEQYAFDAAENWVNKWGAFA